MNNEQDDRFEKRLRFVARRYKEGSLDTDKAWERFAARQGIRRKVSFRRYWMAAASVMLLLVGFGTLYYDGTEQTRMGVCRYCTGTAEGCLPAGQHVGGDGGRLDAPV